MKKIKLNLPYPPSANTYWRHSRGRHYISNKGKKFRRDVCLICARYRNTFEPKTELTMAIKMHPPDNRKRDVDNIQKPVLDALQYAGVYPDDSQVVDLRTRKLDKVVGGQLVVTIGEAA